MSIHEMHLHFDFLWLLFVVVMKMCNNFDLTFSFLSLCQNGRPKGS